MCSLCRAYRYVASSTCLQQRGRVFIGVCLLGFVYLFISMITQKLPNLLVGRNGLILVVIPVNHVTLGELQLDEGTAVAYTPHGRICCL